MEREATEALRGSYPINVAAHRVAALSGLFFIGIFLVAMTMVVPLIPPVSPAIEVTGVNQIFDDLGVSIRIASVMFVYACAFGWFWTASVAIWTAKMEGGMPVLSVAQCICGLFSFGGTYFTAIAWISASFRETHSPDIVLLMSDQGWFWIVMMGSCAVLQMLLIGWAILSDQSGDQLFPRWVGYANLWIGLLQTPGIMVAFFKTGPFAWDGVLAFWLPLTTFSLWIFVNTWALLKVIKRVQLSNCAAC